MGATIHKLSHNWAEMIASQPSNTHQDISQDQIEAVCRLVDLVFAPYWRGSDNWPQMRERFIKRLAKPTSHHAQDTTLIYRMVRRDLMPRKME